MIDIAYFPHVFDHIVDELYRSRSVPTLLTLRQASSEVRDVVDHKLVTHIVVRGKSNLQAHTRWGRLRLSPHGPRVGSKVQAVDVHHFDHHPQCNFDLANGFSPCAPEDAVARYLRANRADTVRLFDSKSFPSDACGASTVVHFTEAGYFFGSGIKVRLVSGVRNVINIRHDSNIGLFEVLWGDGDECPEFVPAPTSPAHEVVVLLTPKSAGVKESPAENPDQKRGLLNSIIVSAIAYLRHYPGARLMLVGAETWSPHWFQLWPIDPPPEPLVSVQALWSYVFSYYARVGWTCAPHYAQQCKCTSLDDEEITSLQERAEFVSEDAYRDRVGEETFRLYTVE